MEAGAHKHAAKGYRKEKEVQDRNLQQLEEELEDCEKVSKKAKEDEGRYSKIVFEVDEFQTKLNNLRIEKNKVRSVVDKQRSMLEQDLTKDLNSDSKRLLQVGILGKLCFRTGS